MITELKRKQNGWTIEKMTFPKGYSPKNVTWRHKDGDYQVQITRQVEEGGKLEDVHGYEIFQDIEIKTTAKGTFVVGWYSLGKNYYLYDKADAEKS